MSLSQAVFTQSTGLQICKEDTNRAKYTRHFCTLSEKKPLTNLEKQQQQRAFSPVCMLLVQLALMIFFLYDNQETFIFIIVYRYFDIVLNAHSVHWGINTPSKTLPSPLKSASCVNPLFRQSHPHFILVFRELSPHENRIFG